MRRRLGQHFLKTSAPLQKIIGALAIKAGETIIEIGPGHGELTLPLARAAEKAGAEVVAIEKDAKLAEELKERFAQNKSVAIISGDALKVLPRAVPDGGYVLTGNLPYYISGFLFRTLGELEHKPRRAVFLLQKEVGERIAARPPRMNKLAASVQFWAEPALLGIVPKSDFRPAPEVDGAILKLDTCPPAPDQGKFYSLISALFRQPRQTIFNNLRRSAHAFSREELEKRVRAAGIRPESRPQDLDIEDISRLAHIFED